MRNINIVLSALAPLLCTALAACSGGPPVPDWKMNAQSSVERFQAAYLGGNALVEQTEFRRARSQVAGTGKLELVARIELLRCAARVASLAFEDCAGFDALQADANDADRAYAAYLAGKAQAAEVALLPEAQRAAAGAASDTAAAGAVAAIDDPLSRLVAAGVLLRAGRATPALLDTAVATASDQGWRRPLLAWLGVQRLRAEQAGDAQAAQRIARRMAIVEQPPAP
ncbi:hypothetical protein GQ37_002440 [Janthinobacterium sp. BJB1]|uniref:hypothetical protein n=1 Tax=Janthinobacterium sp. GW458P TaxID=1981504 RepID=UPI000C0CDEFC|nr:hypothetical protein [Janthinobacterium sp. GW458P]MBE3025426.1 hypothetical protein [Janthinobacterium sp. GW458P]PHV16429.1 hypothetical protein CSQ90_12040 [Janthinobacterium sp. BJB303]PJD00482.1 hypothetical protein GQ37_002440 [Janthinobacterium sp. BJB1]